MRIYPMWARSILLSCVVTDSLNIHFGGQDTVAKTELDVDSTTEVFNFQTKKGRQLREAFFLFGRVGIV